MNKRPSYYDPTAPAECYVYDDSRIKVVVPSDIWIDAEQAEKFGKALIECAEWVRDQGRVEWTDKPFQAAQAVVNGKALTWEGDHWEDEDGNHYTITLSDR